MLRNVKTRVSLGKNTVFINRVGHRGVTHCTVDHHVWIEISVLHVSVSVGGPFD